MKPFKASLRLLYQNREMWAWYFILAVSIYHILSSLPTPQSAPTNDPVNGWGLIAPNLALAVLGCAMGRITAGIWTKPVFFCVPGQKVAIRRMLMLIGLAASAITYLVMAILLPWPILRSLNMQVALIGFYLQIYFLCLILSIRFNKLIFFIPYFILFFIQLMNRLEILSFIQGKLLIYPWSSAVVCWMINGLIYFTLATNHFPRRLFGMPAVIFFTGLESSGSNGYRPSGLTRERGIKRATEIFGQIFLDRIRSANQSPVSPHVWGRIYMIFGAFISNLRVVFFDGPIIFLSAAILINSFRFVEMQSFLYGFIGLFGGLICVMSRSDIFLPIDGKGRFVSELTALATAIFIMLILAALFDLFSKILPRSVTSFIYLNWGSEFISLQVKYIFFTMMLLPMTTGLLILFKKKSFLALLSMTGLAIVLLGAHKYVLEKTGYAFNLFSVLAVILTACVSLGFYLTVIYYGSIKRSIV
jgi:hypothetical protein